MPKEPCPQCGSVEFLKSKSLLIGKYSPSEIEARENKIGYRRIDQLAVDECVEQELKGLPWNSLWMAYIARGADLVSCRIRRLSKSAVVVSDSPAAGPCAKARDGMNGLQHGFIRNATCDIECAVLLAEGRARARPTEAFGICTYSPTIANEVA